MHAAKLAGTLESAPLPCGKTSAAHLNFSAALRDGADERLACAPLPGTNAVLRAQGEFVVAAAEHEEGPEPGGGVDHGWGTRHRTSPGKRVCQAGGQKGNVTRTAGNLLHLAGK